MSLGVQATVSPQLLWPVGQSDNTVWFFDIKAPCDRGCDKDTYLLTGNKRRAKAQPRNPLETMDKYLFECNTFE